jgi:hypothetical protein
VRRRHRRVEPRPPRLAGGHGPRHRGRRRQPAGALGGPRRRRVARRARDPRHRREVEGRGPPTTAGYRPTRAWSSRPRRPLDALGRPAELGLLRPRAPRPRRGRRQRGALRPAAARRRPAARGVPPLGVGRLRHARHVRRRRERERDRPAARRPEHRARRDLRAAAGAPVEDELRRRVPRRRPGARPRGRGRPAVHRVGRATSRAEAPARPRPLPLPARALHRAGELARVIRVKKAAQIGVSAWLVRWALRRADLGATCSTSCPASGRRRSSPRCASSRSSGERLPPRPPGAQRGPDRHEAAQVDRRRLPRDPRLEVRGRAHLAWTPTPLALDEYDRLVQATCPASSSASPARCPRASCAGVSTPTIPNYGIAKEFAAPTSAAGTSAAAARPPRQARRGGCGEWNRLRHGDVRAARPRATWSNHDGADRRPADRAALRRVPPRAGRPRGRVGAPSSRTATGPAATTCRSSWCRASNLAGVVLRSKRRARTGAARLPQ